MKPRTLTIIQFFVALALVLGPFARAEVTQPGDDNPMTPTLTVLGYCKDIKFYQATNPHFFDDIKTNEDSFLAWERAYQVSLPDLKKSAVAKKQNDTADRERRKAYKNIANTIKNGDGYLSFESEQIYNFARALEFKNERSVAGSLVEDLYIKIIPGAWIAFQTRTLFELDCLIPSSVETMARAEKLKRTLDTNRVSSDNTVLSFLVDHAYARTQDLLVYELQSKTNRPDQIEVQAKEWQTKVESLADNPKLMKAYSNASKAAWQYALVQQKFAIANLEKSEIQKTKIVYDQKYRRAQWGNDESLYYSAVIDLCDQYLKKK